MASFLLATDLIEKHFVQHYKMPALQEKGEAKQQGTFALQVSYCERALKIKKIPQGVTFKHYNYQKKLLSYIRALVPNYVKDEILEEWYEVLLKEVCEAV